MTIRAPPREATPPLVVAATPLAPAASAPASVGLPRGPGRSRYPTPYAVALAPAPVAPAAPAPSVPVSVSESVPNPSPLRRSTRERTVAAPHNVAQLGGDGGGLARRTGLLTEFDDRVGREVNGTLACRAIPDGGKAGLVKRRKTNNCRVLLHKAFQRKGGPPRRRRRRAVGVAVVRVRVGSARERRGHVGVVLRVDEKLRIRETTILRTVQGKYVILPLRGGSRLRNGVGCVGGVNRCPRRSPLRRQSAPPRRARIARARARAIGVACAIRTPAPFRRRTVAPARLAG